MKISLTDWTGDERFRIWMMDDKGLSPDKDCPINFENYDNHKDALDALNEIAGQDWYLFPTFRKSTRREGFSKIDYMLDELLAKTLQQPAGIIAVSRNHWRESEAMDAAKNHLSNFNKTKNTPLFEAEINGKLTTLEFEEAIEVIIQNAKMGGSVEIDNSASQILTEELKDMGLIVKHKETWIKPSSQQEEKLLTEAEGKLPQIRDYITVNPQKTPRFKVDNEPMLTLYLYKNGVKLRTIKEFPALSEILEKCDKLIEIDGAEIGK